jgi:hypothetical protein
MSSGKKCKFSSGSKKWKCGYGGTYGGVWCSVHLARVWSQEGGFVLVHLAGDTFTFTLLQKEIYKFCTSIFINFVLPLRFVKIILQ